MFSARVFIVVLWALFAGDVSFADDSGCVGWDDKVEDLLFAPLKDELKKAASEFYSLPDLDSTLGWGVSLKLKKATMGNLTSFDIVHLPNAQGEASYMCQSGNNMTLAIDLGLTDLELRLDDFVTTLPVLPDIGNTKTTIKNSGNAISISVSLIADSESNCKASLNYIQLRELGETSVNFDHGLINSVYQFTFNHLYNLIVKIMIHYGVMDRFNQSLQLQASKIIAEQGSKICDIINGGGL